MVEVPRLDIQKLFKELEKEKVQYVVIGGIAAQQLGLPVPATIDLDITPKRSAENYKRLSRFFENVGAALFTAEDGGTWFPHHLLENWSQYNTLHLLTRFGLLDLVFSPEGAPSGYSQLAPDSQVLSVELLKIRLITEEQWVALKIAAGREKDIEHLSMYYRDRDVN
jgi:hypothetical protein